MQKFLRLWFSFQGRASRTDYWVRFVFVFVVTLIAAFLLDRLLAAGGLVASFWQFALLWPTFAVGVKRFHDRGRPGRGFVFLQLALLAMLFAAVAASVPVEQAQYAGYRPPTLYVALMFGSSIAIVVLAIYLLVVLGFRKGTAGPNRFGPDPLAAKEPA